MDRTSMDSVSMSISPTELFIPQKENTNNGDEKSIIEMECTPDSADCFTQRGLNLNIDPDAGANAGSREEITFGTNNPLSELVWSPRKGLSLKCADFSLIEKKSSLFWNSESGNMIISSPTNIKAWESYNNVTMGVGDLSSTQLAPNPESGNSSRETLVRSHRSTEDMMPPRQTRTRELNMRSCGDMEPLTTMSVSDVDVNHADDDKSAEKEIGICSPIDIQGNVELSKERTVTAATLPKKNSLPDPDDRKYAAALSVKPEDAKIDRLPVEPYCGDSVKGTDSAPFERSGEIGCGNIQRACLEDPMVSEASTVKRHSLPGSSMSISRSLDGKNDEPDLVIEENSRNKMVVNPKLIEIPCVEKLESTAENDADPLEIACTEMHVESEGKKFSAHNPRMSAIDDKAALVEASPNNRRKGKEKALSDTEVDRIISKGKDDSHESVESCNRRLFAKGKRAWSFEREVVSGNKKIKKQHHETPHSASFFGQDNSFMNWISNMVKSLPKFDTDGAPSLPLTVKPSDQRDGNHNSPSTLCDKKQKDRGFNSIGFQNVLQASYCPIFQLEDKNTGGFNDKKGARGSKELEVANKIPFDVSPHGYPDKGRVKLHTFIPKSNERPQVGECPSIQPIIASANNIIVSEKPESDFGKNHNTCSFACGLETGGIRSSKSSFLNDSCSSPEGQGARKIVSVDPNTSSNLVTNKSKSLGSLWITRFSPKVSEPVSNSMQFNQDIGADIKGFTDCNSLFPRSQNVIFPVKGQHNLEVSHESSTKNHKNTESRNVHNYSVSPFVSCGSKRIDIHTDQKFKPKLSPFIPSQEFKSSDAMFSSFARRLDDLKHIIPLKVTDSAAHADTFCYFCGIHGHTDCSGIIDSELKDLLENINLHDGAEETPSFCIKCFQLSHWAIACPHVSSRKQINTHGKTPFAGNKICDRILHNPRNQSPLTNHDRKNMLLSETSDGKHLLLGPCTILHEENSKEETESMVQTNVGRKLCDTVVLNERISDSKTIKMDIPGDDGYKEAPGKATSKQFLLMGRSTASSSENGLKEKQISPFHNHVNRQIPYVPQGTFEAIRKLRLSRTDILKWKESPIFNFSLEGYFLRFRLGKWEAGLGGTGYHVACISGTSQKGSCGACKLPISVDIGGLKCLVDCRYVSNHDFIEDELMSWWCATLRGNGRLPSEEDLSLKLLERKRCGF